MEITFPGRLCMLCLYRFVCSFITTIPPSIIVTFTKCSYGFAPSVKVLVPNISIIINKGLSDLNVTVPAAVKLIS